MRAEMLSRTSTCWLYLVAAMMMMNAGCSSHADSVTRTEQVRLDSVIEADELTRLLAGSTPYRPVILDVRDASAYEQGHVAGAVRVDFAIWKDESLAADTGLDHETLWRTRIGSLGVSGREPVVIYDDGRMTEAARVWFIFQHFGGLEAAVLNGGYPALAKLIEGHRIETSRKVAEPVSVKFEPKSTAATHVGLVEREQLRSNVEKGKVQVFDTRTREEYIGEDLRKNTRGGHIPTAINVPHKELLDEQNRLKSPEALRTLLEQAGFKRGQPVITHCDGGGRASLAALAASRAGYGPVLNYYLSYGDWAADATCPVVRPGE